MKWISVKWISNQIDYGFWWTELANILMSRRSSIMKLKWIIIFWNVPILKAHWLCCQMKCKCVKKKQAKCIMDEWRMNEAIILVIDSNHLFCFGINIISGWIEVTLNNLRGKKHTKLRWILRFNTKQKLFSAKMMCKSTKKKNGEKHLFFVINSKWNSDDCTNKEFFVLYFHSLYKAHIFRKLCCAYMVAL